MASWTNPFPGGITKAGGYTPGGINSNYKTATVQQWSLTVDCELQKDLALEVTYLGSHGSDLQESYNINQPTPAAGVVQARRPYTQWGPINYVNSNGGSSFNSFSAQLTRRYSQGLTLLSSYTYSHSLDDAPYSGFIQNPLNLASQWGSSDFDIKHRSVTSFTYELPFGTGKPFAAAWRSVPRQAVSGWQLNGIFSFQSGLPFTVTTTKDIANVGLSNTYAQRVPGQDPTLSNRTPNRWFNTAAFTDVLYPAGSTPVYAYGNSGRNLLRGDGVNNLDAGLYRRVPLHREMQLQFRFEAFNILNHPSFGAPTSNIESTSYGTVNSTISTARQTQFAVKFLF